jgi:hypothetical protein
MRTEDVVRSAEKEDAYFRFISSKLEPAGTRGNNEEARVVMFGWSNDPVNT